MTRVTCISPVNIAAIKYWGKRDENLILPLNDSLSLTLSTDQMQAKTTVMISPSFERDRIWLNGREETFDNKRLQSCLNEIRKRAGDKGKSNKDTWKVHVCSENNFPTAAGLASSAAGYACLVSALAKLYDVKGDLSSLARLGSGSACRSLYGGFVQWHKGEKEDGSDSLAVQVEPASHWPTLSILILVVSDSRKKVDSSSAMKRSVETSSLLKHRTSHIVPKSIEEIIKAIKTKNFERFAELTMKDSNSMHSVCLDSYPPVIYMNDVSRLIIDFVHAYNKSKGANKVAYTFDAGPNGCLFLEKENVPEVVSLIKQVFPPANEKNFIRGLEVPEKILDKDFVLPSGLQEVGRLKYVIHTALGEGPKELKEPDAHLLDANGLPINTTILI